MTTTTTGSPSAEAEPGKRLRFGVLGTGAIASEVVDAIRHSDDCETIAVASRDPRRAEDFCAAHHVPTAYGGYDALLADRDVDIVYIATPHPQHAAWAIRAAEAGKDVLCEKPLALNATDAAAMIDAARRHQTFLIEAFAYLHHPQTHTLLRLVREGAIGEVCVIDVSFSYAGDAAAEPRILVRDLGGGAILDVGCYCVSAARQIAAAATGRPGIEPTSVTGMASLDPVQAVDRYAAGILRFERDILAQLATGVTLDQDDHVRVYGTGGHLHIERPCWHGRWRDNPSPIILTRRDYTTETIAVPTGRSVFAYQADGVAAMLARGRETCHESWQDTLASMRTLDRWRAACGVYYNGESPTTLGTEV
jgi:predicted dehydrogenase